MQDGDFPLVESITAPGDSQPDGAHVVDYEVQKMLSLGWQKYVRIVRETAGGDLPDAVAREITTSFEGECRGGEQLTLGVRAATRTRRSYTLEEHLWNPQTQRTIARSRVGMTGIDRSTGRAAEVPDHVWAAVEGFEGRNVGGGGSSG
jgi:hypothetical protein